MQYATCLLYFLSIKRFIFGYIWRDCWAINVVILKTRGATYPVSAYHPRRQLCCYILSVKFENQIGSQIMNLKKLIANFQHVSQNSCGYSFLPQSDVFLKVQIRYICHENGLQVFLRDVTHSHTSHQLDGFVISITINTFAVHYIAIVSYTAMNFTMSE